MTVLFCLAVASTATYAGVGIDWNTVNGVAWNGAAQSVLDGSFASGESLLDRYSAIWQLIYAGANNNIDPVSLATGGANGDYVSGDDVVWAQRIIGQNGNPSGPACADGTQWGNWMTIAIPASTVYQNLSWSTAGFVYQRVFEGTPMGGSWYYESADTTALVTTFSGGSDLAQQVFVDTADNLAKPLNQIPVPEPATMGLLGLGALVMAIRRRRS